MNPYTHTSNEPMRVGDRVRVKSLDAILETLDEQRETGGMPFMPEMLPLCGQSLTVSKRSDKTCDTVMSTGLRRMTDTVHLDDLRCDGSAHGGCQTNCRFFWREEWLIREPSDDPSGHDANDTDEARDEAAVKHLNAVTTLPDTDPNRPVRYSCQATRVRAGSHDLSVFDLRQYVRDVTSGNASVRRVVPGLLISLFNKYQDLSLRLLPRRLQIRDGVRYPFITGTLERTPSERTGLQPGDLVQIKSREEIEATLDRNNNNRGMSFDVEMLKYCGRFAKVKSRVERLIDETSGEMLELANECIILDNVVCDGDFHRFCPRGMYPFWREIWLRKVDEHHSTSEV
ncbi:hypothetical protein BH23ACT10_BH23ACT10_17780 [soil metagenome]